MDSLLANYASSDDEEQQDNQQPPQRSNPSESLQPLKTPSSSLFSLPKPQSSSLFSSLPHPKSQLSDPQFTPKTTSSSISTSQNHGQTVREEQDEQKGLRRDPNSGSKFSSELFSSLPAPKSQPNSVPISSSSGSGSTSHKRVVQFRPPVIQSSFKSDDKDDDEDDDDEYLDKKKPQVINPSSSFKSFISSMPAPMNSATLGTLSGSGGSGRRAIVETSAPSINSEVYMAEEEVGNGSNVTSVQNSVNDGSVSGSLGAAEGKFVAGGDVTNWGQPSESYAGYESYESYGNYDGYASYGNDGHYDQSSWANAPSTWVTPETSGAGIVESVARVSGKRGRNQIPTEIVEVSQDDLMKNRPRQDQVKLTGIAFGPAYQPAPTGGSNKPTKLHKRKHQIGSLYFDMRQKEMELAERRAKGMLTKAETQAKYGW